MQFAMLQPQPRKQHMEGGDTGVRYTGDTASSWFLSPICLICLPWLLTLWLCLSRGWPIPVQGTSSTQDPLPRAAMRLLLCANHSPVPSHGLADAWFGNKASLRPTTSV